MSIVSNMATESRPIKWIFDEFKANHLFVDESFQRNYTWLRKDKISLIETVILGFPIPEIYLWETGTDAKTGDTKYSIIDGQQRIRTLGAFIDDELKLTDGGLEFTEKNYKGKKFSELSDEIRRQIWGYKVSIRFVNSSVSRDEIVKMFLRLNRTSAALNPQELRNAEFDGKFLKASEDVASLPFWNEWGIFSDNEKRRMQDIQFASTLLIFVRSGFEDETTQSAINKMYDQYNENYPSANEDIGEISKSLNILGKMIELQPELLTPLKKKTHLYSSFTLAYAMQANGALNIDRVAELLRDWFDWAENGGQAPKDLKGKVEEYRRLSQEGVQKKSNRLTRFTLIKEYVHGHMD